MFIADILVRDTSRMPATRTRVAALANMSRRVAKVSAAAMAIVTAAANQSSRRGVLGCDQQAERAGEDEACGCDRDRARQAPD